jgi:membrane-associated phospholipid phosphatase
MIRSLTIIILFQISIPSFSQGNDYLILEKFYSNRNSDYDNTLHLVSHSVTPLSFALPVALLVKGYSEKNVDTWDDGIRASIALGSAMTVTYIMKYTINRERPYDTYPDIIPFSRDFTSSFPSGHTTSAFATATTLTILKPEWYVIIPAYSYAALVGYSRMHLGMHYPSDVIIGALIGSGFAYLSYKLNKLVQPAYMYPPKMRVQP